MFDPNPTMILTILIFSVKIREIFKKSRMLMNALGALVKVLKLVGLH